MPKHIKRLIILMVAFGAAALLAKSYFTVDSFYEYGHYRAKSVPEIAAQAPAFQTPRYCQPCHAERVALWSANSHKTVICEVCHGPAQGHPANGKLPIPADTRKLCTLCHEPMAGRPRASRARSPRPPPPRPPPHPSQAPPRPLSAAASPAPCAAAAAQVAGD